MPKISVIIPAHNSAWCLGNTLECFRRQTLTDFEVIVCNNCSTDATREIAEAYCRGDERYNLCDSPVRSAGAARNQGLLRSSGELVAFFDADDRPDDDYLRAFAAAFSQADVGCVISDFRSEDLKGKILGVHRNFLAESADPVRLFTAVLSGRLRLAPTVIAHRRSLLSRYGIKYVEGLSCFEDIPLWCESILASAKVKSIRGSYAAYVRHERQSTKETGAREEQFYCERAALLSIKERLCRLRERKRISLREYCFLARFIDEVMFPHMLVKHMSFCLKHGEMEKYRLLLQSGETERYIFRRPGRLLPRYFQDTWAKVLLLNNAPSLFERYYYRRR